MSRNVIEIRAEPEAVFAVLVDPYAYGFWVVGPDRVITASDDWPDPRATFRHEMRWGPLVVSDETELEEIDPPRRIVLCAKIRPFGVYARIEITLEPTRTGTRLSLDEVPTRGLWRPVWNPVFDRLMWVRNIQALERLKALAEELAGLEPSTAIASTEQPGAKTLAGMVTGLAFWALSSIRGKRVFHPEGEAFEAELEMSPDAGISLFADRSRTRRALVRVSKGAGLPGSLPDVYGLAIKIPDAWGEGADQDLLLATSGDGPVGRHVLRPARAPSGRFSTILPYESHGETFVFGARADGEGDTITSERGTTFALELASPGGGWRRIASVRLVDPFAGAVSYDPWNTSPDMVPWGMLNAMRRPAYEGSREGRDTSGTTDRARAVSRPA